MKTAALITYHASHNIGSMLQTYALQHVLSNRYKLCVEIIDFSSAGQQALYSLFSKELTINAIIKNIAVALLYPMFKKRFNDFEKFLHTHFLLTASSYRHTEDLNDLGDRYDYYVCGSDQIWNVSCADFDDAYFLPFVKNRRRIAYAPSLGGRNILHSNQCDKYREYLSKFDYLSVRERNGKKWLDELSAREFTIVADPTLLVSADIWGPLTLEREYQGDYIFFYGVPFSPDTYSKVYALSKRLKMPVVMMDIKSWVYRLNFIRGFKLSSDASPASYLSLMKNARLVVTTSFHGTIFAATFRKDFWTLTFKGTNKDDDRIVTLLSQLNMLNRQVYVEDLDTLDALQKVDYSSYERDLKAFRDVSYSFLDHALS